MTIRDIGESFSGLWQVIQGDVRTVFSENILDWPLWASVVVVLLFVGIVVPVLYAVKSDEATNIDNGIWGSIWLPLIGFFVVSYTIFAAFPERHELRPWFVFVGLILWLSFGYSFLLRLRRWWGK